MLYVSNDDVPMMILTPVADNRILHIFLIRPRCIFINFKSFYIVNPCLFLSVITLKKMVMMCLYIVKNIFITLVLI